MTILIVGGKGFIGTPLVKQLKQTHDVHVWDLPDTDIRDSQTCANKIQELKPDLVMNLAAILGDMFSTNIAEIMNTNHTANTHLIEACVKNNVKQYIFASSLTVHGENDIANPCSLASPLAPKHPYSASKAAAEFTLMQYARTFDISIAAVRPVSIIGDTYMNHAPLDFVKTLLRGNNIEIYGSGDHEREWLWLDDVVEGFSKVAEYMTQTAKGYHSFFLSGNRIAMNDLALAAKKLIGGSVIFVPKKTQAFTLTCDMNESSNKLEWSPQHDINSILTNTIKMIQSGNSIHHKIPDFNKALATN